MERNRLRPTKSNMEPLICGNGTAQAATEKTRLLNLAPWKRNGTSCDRENQTRNMKWNGRYKLRPSRQDQIWNHGNGMERAATERTNTKSGIMDTGWNEPRPSRQFFFTKLASEDGGMRRERGPYLGQEIAPD